MAEPRSSETLEIVADYTSSLQELTINSKPHINLLTILAEENIVHAAAIVEAIEAHLLTVRSEIKLPVLYLIDSIIKNVVKNPAYLHLFTKNIVTMFCHVFERVDESTRASMWKLRSTWNEVFASKKLYKLDVKVNSIDPAWPVTTGPDVPQASATATSIHVNPKFLSMQQQQAKQQQQQNQQQAATQPEAVAPTPAPAVAPIVVAQPVAVKLPPPLSYSADKAEAEMRDQLLKKQRELLELQKQKIELELLQAKANLEQQRRQLDKQNTLLKPELILAHGTLDKPVAGITGTNHAVKPIEKQFPAAAAAMMKSDLNKTSIKIAPASSIAVAAAKSVTSRDPRLKSATTGAPATKSTVATPSAEEFVKQQQLLQQFKLHMQSKQSGDQSSLLNDAMLKGTSEPEKNKSLDNKRAKDACQKKDPCIPITNATNALTSQRSNSIVKEQSKSSPSKSSSTRNSSSSKTSSSSSRKVGSKSRSKSSSNSPSPNKIAKLEDSSPPSSDSKRLSSKKSSSSSSKSSHKTHSPSPSPANVPSSNGSYRIPRRSNNAQDAIAVASSASGKSSSATGLVEEEQSGSLIVSAPHPPVASFKELRSSTRNRNYIRRNKEGSRSPPEIIIDGVKDSPMPDASKDEDLRAPIVNVNVVALASLDTKEDLDLRVLAVPTGKRQSTDILESANTKKSKTKKIDALFGNEDTDLRTLTNPKAGRPPTPPPPVISSENQNKDKGWAKIKTPVKTDRDTPKPLSDRNRDRLGRPRLYSKTEDPKDRRVRPPTATRDLEKHSENKDLHMELMMKEAAEQLNHGSISKMQYNKLIQEVLQMSEDQKLRAAQRKELEGGGMLVWEKNMDGPNYTGGNDENVRKEHPNMHQRGQGPSGPRWQGHWNQSPWAHPPPPGPFPTGGPHGFPPGGAPEGFRPRGPWQNHSRLFGPGPMRPDFNHFPRMGAPPPMGLYRPPMMMPNGPMHPMGGGPMGPMPPGMMMGNGPIRPDMKKNNMPNAGPGVNNFNNASPNATGAKAANATVAEPNNVSLGSPKNSGELPPPDPELLAEIAKDTMKSINIDSRLREIRYYGTVGIVFLSWDDPRDIGFQDGARRIFIDGKEIMICNFNTDYKEFTYENEVHKIKLGSPTRELYVNGKWYECYFGGRPIPVELGQRTVNISLEGPPPQVKIGFGKRTDLVLGKINLIINARNMVPVFLDAKPQMFEIEGQPCTLEFADALQTVLLNGRPFKVEFGGLPKPIMVLEKKHFIRFSVLPRGFRAGYVRIANMKGERPRTPPQNEIAEKSDATPAATAMNAVMASTSATTNVSANIDLDSASQDGMDVGAGSKSDLQLDVLSSVMPSAMAPSTGQSYQAEPAENAPAPTPAVAMPLDLNTLFQRLVETGIVPSLENLDAKKPEEEEKKEPEVNPVTFDKPETLKTKQPAIVTALYSGVQCGTCGARWEMATRYSHHLDWHFRQNRKERDSARKAHSRSWYYDVGDWIQFEEVEDMEDRAQNWFETEKQTAEIEGATADASPLKAQQPSVPTGSDEEACCVMCHEAFEQFYNNEKDEWHLYPTVNFEDKNYHPLCLEDHKSALEKSALELEEVIAEMEEATDKEEVQEDEEEKDVEMKEDVTIKEEKDKEENVEITEESDVKPEIKKGEEDEDKKSIKDEKIETVEKDEKAEKMDVDDSEPIEIIEPLPRQIVLEEIDDSSDDENNEDSTKDKAHESNNNKSESKPEEKIPDDVPLIFENVKVKEEPIDETEIEESIAEAAAVDTTQVEVKSSIDGNVEFQSAASSMPAAASKIKINITKNLGQPKSPPTSSKEKEKKPTESPVETAPAKPLIPAAIKPALQGKKLSILPTVEKGHELSGLCRLM